MPKSTRATDQQEPQHSARRAAEKTPAAAPDPRRLQRLPENAAAATAGDVAQLQARYGNRAVQHLLSRPAIQAKLQVGPADDAYEQEADRVADQVMRMPAVSGKEEDDEKAKG